MALPLSISFKAAASLTHTRSKPRHVILLMFPAVLLFCRYLTIITAGKVTLDPVPMAPYLFFISCLPSRRFLIHADFYVLFKSLFSSLRLQVVNFLNWADYIEKIPVLSFLFCFFFPSPCCFFTPPSLIYHSPLSLPRQCNSFKMMSEAGQVDYIERICQLTNGMTRKMKL